MFIWYKGIEAHLLSECKHWGERPYVSFVSLTYTYSPGTLVPWLADNQPVGLSQQASRHFLNSESNHDVEAKVQTFVQ